MTMREKRPSLETGSYRKSKRKNKGKRSARTRATAGGNRLGSNDGGSGGRGRLMAEPEPTPQRSQCKPSEPVKSFGPSSGNKLGGGRVRSRIPGPSSRRSNDDVRKKRAAYFEKLMAEKKAIAEAEDVQKANPVQCKPDLEPEAEPVEEPAFESKRDPEPEYAPEPNAEDEPEPERDDFENEERARV